MHKDKDKKNLLNRLKRAEGQLRGVQKMLEEDRDCMDIVTQLTAIRSSVDRIMGIVMVENLKECLTSNNGDSEIQNQRLEQAVSMIIKK
ncbi:metal-sensitive transcriptional regulator [Facklamia sp. 7083-14-GEN3]|uniref:metal-sensitive transcriptional regulator n=1 Tax=Facklamia sp. 7083-14-GEN3 TaxID=2973478 RepID=UPI00215C6FE7|nr:metal-sensitive transcriptional regulator [Facklamia sp. 7083-14-GEN3]MCR8969889.1 metal-sensitive transcriptional regulator [Facklamia sp. 7083-14-GEN3]